LIYGVDDRPPPALFALLAFQYAVITMIYPVLVGIILRHVHITTDEGLRVLTIACMGLATGTILQALRGPIGSGFLALPVYSAVFLAPFDRCGQTRRHDRAPRVWHLMSRYDQPSTRTTATFSTAKQTPSGYASTR